MNFKIIKPVRKFEVGGTGPTIELSHVMDLMLEADEQVTLVAEAVSYTHLTLPTKRIV